MDTKIHFTLGFKIDEVYFGFHDGVLYQLPYMQDGRYYGLRRLRKKKLQSGWEYYHVRRKKIGVERLRAMLQSVKWDITKPVELNKVEP